MQSKILVLIFVIISLFIFIFVGWRLVSRRTSLPCPSWLGWMLEADNPFTKINRAATIVVSLELQPGMTVLDAGCGPGRVTIPLAHTVGPQGKVIALDLQEKMLAKVKEKAHAADLSNITLLHAGLGDGKLEHNIYDRAILVSVLGEIPNQKKALQEIFDALKPGGMLSITETMFDPHYQRLNDVRKFAQEIGFREKKVFSDWFSYNLLLKKPISK